MFSTLALAAVLNLLPAQNAPLAISNDRITLGGEFGPTRPTNKLLPGDIFYLAFDIENLKRDPQGKVKYSIGVEITDPSGKSIYAPKPADQELILTLGGNRLPSRVYYLIPLGESKGQYNCKLTVTDRTVGTTKSLDRAFEILPLSFGSVRVTASIDEDGGIPTPLRGTEGQPFYLTYFIVGFARHAQTKQPNVTAEIRVFDQEGNPTNEKPLVAGYDRGVSEQADVLKFVVPIPMNHAGSYTVEIKTQCKIGGQSDTIKLPIKVMPVEK